MPPDNLCTWSSKSLGSFVPQLNIAMRSEIFHDAKFRVNVIQRSLTWCYSPMIAFCPANAEIVVVMSAFPRLISGKLGRLGVEAVMVDI